MDEQQASGQTWSWPERNSSGVTSSDVSSVPPSNSALDETVPPLDQPPDDGDAVEATELNLIRSTVMGLVGVALTTAVSFGVPLTEDQRAAVSALAASVVGVVLLILALRRRRQRRG